MNRVVVQEGYKIPFSGFEGYKKRGKKKGKARGRSRQTSKMSTCAKRWRNRKGYEGSYRTFMKRCLKK